MVHTEHEHEAYDVHFTALFSKMKNATPVISVHGWPGGVAVTPHSTPDADRM